MKPIIFFLCTAVCFLLWSTGWAQNAGAGIQYQLVIRDALGNLVTGTQVGVSVSLLQGSASGTEVYGETHTPTTNDNGLVSFVIGEGANQSGTIGAVDWSAGPYFLKLETDPSGGTNYSSSSVMQFLSVPYAMYASSVDSVRMRVSALGDTLYYGDVDTQYVVIPGLSAVNNSGGSYPPGYQFCDGVVTEIVDVVNPETNVTWMDRNLGARQVADSSKDVRAYGDLFQWGRFADGHQCRFPLSTTTEIKANTSASSPEDIYWYGKFILEGVSPYDWLITQDTNLWKGTDGVNNPCPIGYRLPTEAEWNAERISWGVDPINSTNTSAGAMASPLKLPVAGRRLNGTGALDNVGIFGNYWSSSINGTFSQNLYFSSSTEAATGIGYRANARSIRCLKDQL